MSSIIDVTKLVSLFIEIDDFALSYTDWNNKKCLITPELGYSQKSLSDSEIMTILVLYQESGYKNFQYFYERFAMNELRTYFPKLVSYSRFVEYIPMVFWEMYFFTQYRCALAARTGLYITDSKKIEVCKLRKSKHHKVFKELASKSKSSTGWFFGLKIHLVINDLGEIVKFEFTTGKVADNNHELLKRQFQGLEGKCAGDRGYLSTLFDFFYQQGLQIVTKIKAKMKNKLMPMADRNLIQNRPIIESIFDILATVFDLEHTRHRSPKNAFIHMFAALTAYSYYERKPKCKLKNNLKTMSLVPC